MKHTPSEPPMARPLGVGLTTVAILLTSCVMVTVMVASGAESSDAIALFGRLDVLGCALVVAAPLSVRIARPMEGLTVFLRLAAAAAMLSSSGGLYYLGVLLGATSSPGEVVLALWRGGIAVALMTAAILLGHLVPRQQARVDFDVPEWAIYAGLIGLTLLVPALYADAVADGVRANLRQSLENQRLALAYRQAQQLRQLKPDGSVRGTPVDRVAEDLGRAVAALRAEASAQLPQHASRSQVGRRITVLVQLERNEEALRLVQPLTRGDRLHPVALDFFGLCCQRLGRFGESLRAYERAARYWEDRPAGPAKTEGLTSALKGIGFAARKLERRSLEEEAYRRLVEVSPTAESHFLLAQCYREHQKGELAAEHAGRAMQLDPVFSEDATALLSSLSKDHFGCLNIPRR